MKGMRAIALILAVTAASMATPSVERNVGKPLPPFRMTDTAGKTFTSADLKGKVVVLDFWASWCTNCRKVGKVVQDLHTKYAPKGLVAIGANVGEDTEEDKRTWPARYKKQHKYGYRFTLNNDAYASSLGVKPLPALMVIDRNGVVRLAIEDWSPKREKEVRALVAKLVG